MALGPTADPLWHTVVPRWSDQVLGTRREDLVPPLRASRVRDSPGWKDRQQNRNLYNIEGGT